MEGTPGAICISPRRHSGPGVGNHRPPLGTTGAMALSLPPCTNAGHIARSPGELGQAPSLPSPPLSRPRPSQAMLMLVSNSPPFSFQNCACSLSLLFLAAAAMAAQQNQPEHSVCVLAGSLETATTVTVVGDDGSGGHDGTLADCKAPDPSHGRLLPLGKFLIVYGCMSTGTLLGAVDQTVVATILPRISTDFGAARDISWVGTAFLLTSTSFQPIFGSLCDVLGRKASFLLSMLLFAVGTLACGLAPNIISLVLARAVAGLGAGGLMTTVHVVISDVVVLRHRGKYQGILQAVNGAGSCLGPLAGGIFVKTLSWRWAFYFQVPIAGAAFIASLFFLPSTGKPAGSLRERFKTLDYTGMLLLVSGTCIFMTGITYGGSTYPWHHPIIISLLVAGPVVILAFVYNESLAAVPLIPGSIFSIAAVDLIFCANFLFGLVFFSSLYYLPLYFQVVFRQDALQSAVSLIPLTVTCIFFSWFSGLMTSLTGNYKVSLIVGYTLMLVASGLIYTLDEHTPRSLVLTYTLLMGCGMGCQLQNSLVAAQSAVRKKDVARTTAVRNFFRNFGGVFGLGISSAILNTTLKGGINALLGPILPDGTTDQIIVSPLTLQVMGLMDEHEDIALNVYIKALRLVFLVWIPASAICFVCGCVVPSYDLDRADDGEPRRKPYLCSPPRHPAVAAEPKL